MHIDDLKQSKYLSKTDFKQPRIVTIMDFSVENVAPANQPKSERGVMMFRELDKGMVMNQTNLKRCAHFLGSPNTDDWIGKKVCVYFDETIEYAGEIKGGLRIRGAQSQQAPQSDPIPGLANDVPW